MRAPDDEIVLRARNVFVKSAPSAYLRARAEEAKAGQVGSGCVVLPPTTPLTHT